MIEVYCVDGGVETSDIERLFLLLKYPGNYIAHANLVGGGGGGADSFPPSEHREH